jgi:hypothetical protein
MVLLFFEPLMATTMGLVSTLGFLITLHAQFAFATLLVGSPLTPNFNIQSGSGDSANSTGYIVCNPNCYIASNSEAQPAYRLTVNVPSRPFGTSRVSYLSDYGRKKVPLSWLRSYINFLEQKIAFLRIDFTISRLPRFDI